MSNTSDHGKETDTDSTKRGLITRRTVATATASALGLGIGGTVFFHSATQPALALEDTNEFVASSASITAHDGSISAVEFGDPDGQDHDDLDDESDRLTLSWEGITDPESDNPDFTLELRGADDPEDEDAEAFGGPATNYQEILDAMDAVTIDSTNGSAAYSWRDVFGQDTADVLEHNGIDASDFEVDDDGEERVRELQVNVSVEWDAEAGLTVEAEEEARATITVINKEANAEIGGQGSFNVESDEEVED